MLELLGTYPVRQIQLDNIVERKVFRNVFFNK